ncbi:MAG TPA: peroxiredoxin [Gemmataceae bacterium]|jgi:peroxiredoxin Q/BCP
MRRWTCALAVAAVTGLFAVAADAPPKEGSPAPDIALPATQIEKALPGKKGEKTLKLSDLKGKKNVVLFFYPKAMTKGCTVESCGFRDVADKLADLDTVVIGISVDDLADQQKFTEKEHLNFPLLADPGKEATKAYGALGQRGLANRYTFIIDKHGVIRKVYTKVSPNTHPEEVVNFVKEHLAKG